MIVTCPSCRAKFRVLDEKVPEDGARLECATCHTVFLALKPPARPAAPPPRPAPSLAPGGPAPISGLSQPVPAQPYAPQLNGALPPPPGGVFGEDSVIASDAVIRGAAPAAPLQKKRPPPAAAPASPPAAKPAPRILTAKEQREIAERKARRGERIGAVLVACGTLVFVGSIVFAGWTTGGLPLDDALMPIAERTFGVRPPRSYIGRDLRTPMEIDTRVKRAEEAGDLVETAVHAMRAAAVEETEARRAARLRALQKLGAE